MGISTNLKRVCLCYFDFVWRHWEGENVQVNGVLDTLPDTLRARFVEATFHNLIMKVSYFNTMMVKCAL